MLAISRVWQTFTRNISFFIWHGQELLLPQEVLVPQDVLAPQEPLVPPGLFVPKNYLYHRNYWYHRNSCIIFTISNIQNSCIGSNLNTLQVELRTKVFTLKYSSLFIISIMQVHKTVKLHKIHKRFSHPFPGQFFQKSHDNTVQRQMIPRYQIWSVNRQVVGGATGGSTLLTEIKFKASHFDKWDFTLLWPCDVHQSMGQGRHISLYMWNLSTAWWRGCLEVQILLSCPEQSKEKSCLDENKKLSICQMQMYWWTLWTSPWRHSCDSSTAKQS